MPAIEHRNRFHPFAAAVALVFMAAMWLPTVSVATLAPAGGMPAIATAGGMPAIAAAGAHTPVLM